VSERHLEASSTVVSPVDSDHRRVRHRPTRGNLLPAARSAASASRPRPIRVQSAEVDAQTATDRGSTATSFAIASRSQSPSADSSG
jgi:hypothetical protein